MKKYVFISDEKKICNNAKPAKRTKTKQRQKKTKSERHAINKYKSAMQKHLNFN